MGFLSSIMGGSQSSSSSGGFNKLPTQIKSAFTGFADQFNNQLGQDTAAQFRPMDLTAGENTAIGNINKGFTPDQNQLTSDINMQMNPYDSSVIDTINRQGQGQYSVLNQASNAAGQLGSNRQLLGANDIDLSRLQQIGTFKQGEYNTALQNALTTLPGLRQQDATNQLGAGGIQRQLGLQQNTSGVSALQALSQALGVLPKTEGSQQSSSSSSNGIAPILSAIFGSDIRLKENIEYIGEENGFSIYDFNYLGGDTRYRGVMAHDVVDYMPGAVMEIDGYLHVDYDMIGMEMREV